jgi:hypothetical protein
VGRGKSGARPQVDRYKLKNKHPEKTNGHGKTTFANEYTRWHISEKSDRVKSK